MSHTNVVIILQLFPNEGMVIRNDF